MNENLDYSNAIPLIKKFEGVRLEAYHDVAGILTIGFGHTAGVTPGERITMSQAEHMLQEDLKVFVDGVKRHVTVQLTSNQLCALVSFTYNVGLSAFYHSHLLTYLNRGLDKITVAEQFLLWTHAGGRVIDGLVTRRKAEAKLFMS